MGGIRVHYPIFTKVIIWCQPTSTMNYLFLFVGITERHKTPKTQEGKIPRGLLFYGKMRVTGKGEMRGKRPYAKKCLLLLRASKNCVRSLPRSAFYVPPLYFPYVTKTKYYVPHREMVALQVQTFFDAYSFLTCNILTYSTTFHLNLLSYSCTPHNILFLLPTSIGYKSMLGFILMIVERQISRR